MVDCMLLLNAFGFFRVSSNHVKYGYIKFKQTLVMLIQIMKIYQSKRCPTKRRYIPFFLHYFVGTSEKGTLWYINSVTKIAWVCLISYLYRCGRLLETSCKIYKLIQPKTKKRWRIPKGLSKPSSRRKKYNPWQ